MTITATIRGVTFGDGTSYCWDEGGIQGLGEPAPRTHDVPRGGADGDVAQNDFLPPRQLQFPIVVGPPTVTDPSAAVVLLEAARVAWTRSQVDLPVVIALEGQSYTVIGRPNGFTVDLSRFFTGLKVIRLLCSFRGVDPTLY